MTHARRFPYRLAALRRLAIGAAAALATLAAPATAQSILRDAETETLLADMSAPLIRAARLNPRDVQVVLVGDQSINAFVAGGQIVYVHAGTLQAATSANEVQGVIAHELGHITGGHVILAERGMKPALGISIMSLVLGIAAMAAGGSEAGAGILAAGQQAAQANYLAFSRTQEASTDAAGAKYLTAAGISGAGYLSFFKKMQQLEYRYGITRKVEFLLDHPVSSERIANLTETLQSSPAWKTPSDPKIEARFRRVQAKLNGYLLPPAQVFGKYPESDRSVEGRYARAYAFHRGGYPDKAEAETAALTRLDPTDPYFREIEGQILLEGGKPAAALPALRMATLGSNNNPLIATTLGHALIATEDKANYPEAIRVLRTAIGRDERNPYAWYQLGTAYERVGDEPRAALATAERMSLGGNTRAAVTSARFALANIPANTSDWIRAQDIAMTGQAELDSQKKRK